MMLGTFTCVLYEQQCAMQCLLLTTVHVQYSSCAPLCWAVGSRDHAPKAGHPGPCGLHCLSGRSMSLVLQHGFDSSSSLMPLSSPNTDALDVQSKCCSLLLDQNNFSQCQMRPFLLRLMYTCMPTRFLSINQLLTWNFCERASLVESEALHATTKSCIE